MPRATPGRRRLLLAAAAVLLLGGGAYLAGRQMVANYHLRLAQAAADRRDFAQVEEHVTACLRIRPQDPDALLLAARSARRAGKYKEAGLYLEELQRLPGNKESSALEYTLMRARHGDLRTTEQALLERVHAESPEALYILEVLAEVYKEQYRVPEARWAANEILARAPDHVPGLLIQGWALEQLNRHAEAVTPYLRAVQLAAEDDLARLSAGEVLLTLRRPAEALEHFENLRQRHPDNAAILLGLARCWRGIGEADRARPVLERLAREYPREGLILGERGQLALQDGQLEEADSWLRRAAGLLPAHLGIHYGLYQCAQGLGHEDDARRFRARVDEIESDLKRLVELMQEVSQKRRAPELRAEVGRLLLRLDKKTDGLRWLHSALQDDPRCKAAHLTLADHCERCGNVAGAAYHRRQAEVQ